MIRTNQRWVRLIVFAAALVLGPGRMVGAQGAQPPTVSIRESAASLVRSGIASNDARTVLAAAQLLITAERASPGLQRVGPVLADTSRPEEQTKSGVFTAAGL